jgi:hypothetical protein
MPPKTGGFALDKNRIFMIFSRIYSIDGILGTANVKARTGV